MESFNFERSTGSVEVEQRAFSRRYGRRREDRLSILLIAVLGMAGFGFLAWLMSSPNAFGAIARTAMPQLGLSCEDKIANLSLSGSFNLQGRKMSIWMGQEKQAVGTAIKDETVAYLGSRGTNFCEAKCKMVRLERFKKDFKPALMELDCEGTRISTLRMPLQLQWIKSPSTGGYEAVVRLGSSLYGVRESAIELDVNRYNLVSITRN